MTARPLVRVAATGAVVVLAMIAALWWLSPTHDAGAVLAAFWNGSFGTASALFSGTLVRAIPLALIGAGLCDNLAFVAFNTGLSNTHTSIVTALASLFSAVTVLLAWAILRERLSIGQWAGVSVILIGVLLVSL